MIFDYTLTTQLMPLVTDTTQHLVRYVSGQNLSPALKLKDGNPVFGRVDGMDERRVWISGRELEIGQIHADHKARIFFDEGDLVMEALA